MVTQVPSGELTSVEQSLVEHVGRGELLDLAADDEAAMRSWGESRTISAVVIRDILRGRLAADPDPHGLRVRGAKITGRLDLENLTTDVNLELQDCLLEEGVVARDARLATVVLDGCQLEHPAEPPLDGARLTCSLLWLNGARVKGHSEGGAVFLVGAHIGGYLLLEGAKLCNDSGSALFADGLQVGHGVYLRDGFAATGSGGDGAVRLLGARIGGDLDCSGAKLCNDSGPALNADGLHVGQAMFIRYGFTATGSGGLGAVRLVGARIGLNLDCRGVKLCNDSGPALHANSLRAGQNMYLADGFTATGGGEGAEDVAVNLTGVRVRGVFRFAPARLEHKVDSHRRLAVDGLTYAGVPDTGSACDWRELLRHGTADSARPGRRHLRDCEARRSPVSVSCAVGVMAPDGMQSVRTMPGWLVQTGRPPAGTQPGIGAIDLHQRQPNGRARWHPGAGEAYGGPAPAWLRMPPAGIPSHGSAPPSSWCPDRRV